MSPARDRDATGRPRNARPRDAAGRPLPREAEGSSPAGVEQAALPPQAALAEAQRLLDTGRPFAAHEVLEAVWKAAPESERDLWRGLAQLAVGLTHLQRGNRRGAVALLRRSAANLADYTGPAAYDVDPARLAVVARGIADAVERDQPLRSRFSLSGG